MNYEIIYADPPWSYGKPMYNGANGISSGAIEDHYPTTVSYTHLTLPTTPYV